MVMQRLCLMMSLGLLTFATSARAQTADATLQSLKAEALDADVAASLAEAGGDDSRLTLYIGDQADKLLLREITLRIDDQAPLHYEYSDAESLALQRGALHEWTLSGLGAGPHSLRADFQAAGAKPGGPRKHGQISQSFGKDGAATVLKLDLVKGSFISEATLELHKLSASPAAIADARLRAIDLLIAGGRYFPAASALLQWQTRNQGAASAEVLSRRLSASLKGLGLTERAAAVDSNLPAAPGSGEDPLVTRYNNALAALQQGKVPEGLAELDAIGRGEFTGPVALALRDQANLTLGYYQLRHRQGAAAVPVFSRVRSPGPCANAALLGLGWALLAPPGPGGRQSAADAMQEPTVQRISTVITPRLTADIAALKREQPPGVPVTSKDQQTALRRALVPWTELTGRDPTDPAVQEGMLATAWSLYHFGAYQQAEDHYLRAIDQFDKTRGWFDAAILQVRSGGMAASIAAHENDSASGWHWLGVDLLPVRVHWWFGDTPETPREVAGNFYFEHLLLDEDFADALQDYRDLRLIAGLLDAHLVKLDAAAAALRERIAALRPRVAAAAEVQRKRLEDLAVAELQQQKKQVEKYLIEARFALASIYDRPAAAGEP